MRVLMVCLGNICRSPLAEGILQDKCRRIGLEWEIDSAGTNGYHDGERPHPLSQSVAQLNGIDISYQRSRKFRSEDMEQFDLIVPMANDVLRDIRYITGKKFDPAKVTLLLDFLFPKSGMDVPDPWSRSIGAYHEVYGLIDQACDKLIEYHTSPKQQ
ncbi:MAG: low molecular weight protein-tyrosine-phosphatase [Chitinophagaceae bacterium]|jgi:protein-tyrosine phosphatase